MYTLEIDGWIQNIRFSASHLLPGHERCGVLHGHSYALHVKVSGEKDKDGFLIDFIVLKSQLRAIADSLNHKILLPGQDERVVVNKKEVHVESNGKKYMFPLEDCVLLPLKAITAENLASYVFDQLLKHLDVPSSVHHLRIGVDEGFGQGAWLEKPLR